MRGECWAKPTDCDAVPEADIVQDDLLLQMIVAADAHVVSLEEWTAMIILRMKQPFS